MVFWSSSSLLFITIQALKCKWILDEVPTVEIVKEDETKEFYIVFYLRFGFLSESFSKVPLKVDIKW